VPVSLKQIVFAEYGMSNARPEDFEVDYLITPDLGGPSLFAHKSAIRTPGVKKLMATQRVEFEILEQPEGPTASNIRTLA